MTAKPSARSRRRSSPGGGIQDRAQAVPQSLVVQTFAILKDKICSADWVRLLPPERELCDWLVVSRGTLRKALACLEHEGLVRSRQGRRWEITGVRQKPARRVPPKHLALLTPFSLNVVAPFEIYWIDSLREHLQHAGHRLEVFQRLDYRGWRSNKVLEELAGEVSPAGWVLRAAPANVQRWFSDRGLPCVIVGSRHGRVALPSVDRDLPAVCRHAAGRLVAKGHTRLVLLIPESGLAGDLACEESFRETAERILRPHNGEVLIAHHDGRPESICLRLAAVMQRRPAPTGFLVTDTRYTLSALSYFLRQGLRVPKEVSLISRDSDHFLEYVVPTVARYAADPILFARKVSRVVLRLVEGGDVLPRDYRVMPRFVPGETLG
jgi:DNA-binding LacI/PurR family transcriptional regulator